MDSISIRIKAFADAKKISIRQIELAIGASNGLLSKAIAKNTDISSNWITLLLEKYPEINSEWLLTGNGEMQKDGRVSSPRRLQKTQLDAIEFGKRIVKTREEVLHLSQTQLANETGATQMMISRLETGAGGNINIIYRLVSYLHEKGYKGEALFLSEFKSEYLINSVNETTIRGQYYHKPKLARKELEGRVKGEIEELNYILYLINQEK